MRQADHIILTTPTGYQKPQLCDSSPGRSSVRLSILFRLFYTLLLSTLVGFTPIFSLSAPNPGNAVYLGHFVAPFAVPISGVFSLETVPFRRSHVSQMRIDRVRCLPGYSDPRLSLVSFPDIGSFFARFFWDPIVSFLKRTTMLCQHLLSSGSIQADTGAPPMSSPIPGSPARNSPVLSASGDTTPLIYLCHVPALRLRGGCGSEDSDIDHEGYSMNEEFDSVFPGWDDNDNVFDLVVNFEATCTKSQVLSTDVHDNNLPPFYIPHAPASRLRGGRSSDSSDHGYSTSDEPDSDASGPSHKRKRKAIEATKPHKSSKGKGKAKAESQPDGIRVTIGKGKQAGMYVDEVVHLESAREFWPVPQADHPVAYVLDFTDSPDCISSTVDAFIKKECQDSLTGPTGSHEPNKLADVLILDDGEVVQCRRSNLTCGGFYTCSLAAADHLDGFKCWDDDSTLGMTRELISDPIRTAKTLEAGSLVAVATQFHLSVTRQFCKGKGDDDRFECGGHAGPQNGQAYFIGCSNWSKEDHFTHRFTKIPHGVRESILCKIFRGEEVIVEDEDIVTGPSSSTRSILNGKLPQELHPGMIDNRKRREMIHDAKMSKFPAGTGMQVWNEYEKDKSREIGDRYIHAVSTLADDTHVDTTFVVVHGKTNEWKLLVWLNGLDKRSGVTTQLARRLSWFGTGIFQAIQTITGKELNFKIFNQNSSLLGVIGDSEGAQAQGLGNVIILRRMNPSEIDGIPCVHVDIILTFVWKTCIVHFYCCWYRGIYALEAYIEEHILHSLLGFPYLDNEEDIADYRAFCNASTNSKLQAWWMHKLSYPWLLPSLNRKLTNMPERHWDLTPADTNPIEGSHAQDNQVNHTNHNLITAILLARFASQARRQSRARVKQADALKTDAGAKRLKTQLKASQQLTRDQGLEIQRLRAQLSGGAGALLQPEAGPSTPRHRQRQGTSTPMRTYINVDSQRYSSPVAGCFKLPELNLFPGLPSMDPIHEPRSDFDYALALESEFIDTAFEQIQGRPVYPVNGDDEVLASDPYTP
ncbi:hypothetical protein FB451DRAFT_1177325 [Mycena latifolia]|nr:hypothetical protein FB451DRAFT_1177325 [Mycena latifolia]